MSTPAEGHAVGDSSGERRGRDAAGVRPAHSHLQTQARTLGHALGAVGSHRGSGRGASREQVCAGKLLLGSYAQLVGSSESRER